MKHQGTKIIESERLLLRPFVMEDAKAMFENWASDSAVTKYLMWSPHADIAASKVILSEWIDNYQDICDACYYSLLACEREDFIS